MSDDPNVLMREGGEEPTFADMEREMLSEPEPREQQHEEPQQIAEPKPEPVIEPPTLKGERERRQAAEERQRALESELKAERQRLTEFLEAQRPRAPAPPPPPRIEDDPVGFFKHETEQLRQKVEEAQKASGQWTQQQQHAAAQQQFTARYADDARKFTAEKPDFMKAYGHLMDTMRSDYEDVGYTPQQANQLLMALETELAARAWNTGTNPAATIYKLATKRGYKPADPSVGASTVATIERGQTRASSPLAQATGGSHGGGAMTVDRLARMSASEYAKVPADIRMKALQGKL